MSGIRFGFQTYTWLMSGDAYKDRLDHIMTVGARAGFAGIEPEVVMLGRLAEAGALRAALAASALALPAICLVCDWAGPAESPDERQRADRAIDLVAQFPGAKLVLCQMPGADRKRLRERQGHLISCVHAVARRAAGRGVATSYHPNSPPGSIFRTAEDYEILMGGLGPGVGYTADLGHIAAGGMDPLAVVEKYRSRIDHLHFKDMGADGRWAGMGQGLVDFRRVVARLRETRFDGWIMVEDEGPAAERDPDRATRDNGAFVRDALARQAA